MEEDKTTKNTNIGEARQHFKSAHKAMQESLESLLPVGYRENRRRVRKEILLGLKKLIDAALEKTEKKA